MTTQTIRIDLSKFIEPILERSQYSLRTMCNLSNVRVTSKQYTLGLFDITIDPVAVSLAYLSLERNSKNNVPKGRVLESICDSLVTEIFIRAISEKLDINSDFLKGSEEMQLESKLSPFFEDLIQTINDYMLSAIIMVDQATNTSQAGLFRQAPQKAVVDTSTQTLPKEADVNTQITSRPGQF